MTTYTIATFNHTILACAPDGRPGRLGQLIAEVLPVDMGIRAYMESQLVTVKGVTLFADNVAAFRAGALDL